MRPRRDRWGEMSQFRCVGSTDRPSVRRPRRSSTGVDISVDAGKWFDRGDRVWIRPGGTATTLALQLSHRLTMGEITCGKGADPGGAVGRPSPSGVHASTEARHMSARQAWTLLIVLTLLNGLVSLDRTIAQLIIEPIKQEFGLSDGQIGALLGVAFSIPFGISGLLLGPLADRVNRRRYLAATLSIWSAMTFLTGLASNYLVLLLARAGLGAAEAGTEPAVMSLIGDIFPARRRSTAVGIYKAGFPLGSLSASLITGYVVTEHGWRAAFFSTGAPGFVVALLLLLATREPRRGTMEAEAALGEPVSYREAVLFVVRDRQMAHLVSAFVLWMFGSSALAAFVIAYLHRTFGLSLKSIGIYYGAGSMLSIVSPIVFGIVADRVNGTGGQRIFLFLMALDVLVGASGVTTVLAPSLAIAIPAMLLWQFSSLGLATPCFGVVLSLTPVRMRGTVVSIIMVATMCIGFGVGPLFVGVLSDTIGGSRSLGQALLLTLTATTIASAALFYLAHRRGRRTDQASG